MVEVRTEIKEHFDLYRELVHERKVFHGRYIILEHKASNAKWLSHECDIMHSTIEERVTFIAEKSNRNKKYGFKLRCKTLSEKPFFRFDSDGPAHDNKTIGIALNDRQIPTPHFNCYNENGVAVAYQTHVLKDIKQAEIIREDIYFGLTHYFHETNMSLKDGSFPGISERRLHFDFMNDVKIDLFNGADFD